MFDEMDLWMSLSYFLAAAVTLVLGIAGIGRWRKSSLFLLGAALTQAGEIYAGMNFSEVAGFLAALLNISNPMASFWLSWMFTFAGIVPLLLLLCAVFCDRRSAVPDLPENSVSSY